MVSLVIAIATAVIVSGLGLLGSALIGRAIIDGIKDVCKEDSNEEDS